MIRAVIFDFDGVLANSEPLHFRAIRDAVADRGIVLTEVDYYNKYLGFDDVGAFRAIADAARVALSDADVAELVDQKARKLEALERGQSILFPGAREAVLRMAALGPLAIASGALRTEILRVLDGEGLRAYFPVVVSAEDTAASKPDPAPYVRAVERLGAISGSIAPEECAAVEDSWWGLQSARSGGLRTVAVTHSYAANELTEADVVIAHLDMLTRELLRNIRA